MVKPKSMRPVDPQAPSYKRPEYHNWRRIKRVVLTASILAIIGSIVTWAVVTTYPDVREGDTVRIRYEIWAEGGIHVEGSDDITLFVDEDRAPRALYYQVARAKVGVPRSFSVAACPAGDCEDFQGFTTGPYAWKAIYGNVTVLEILNR